MLSGIEYPVAIANQFQLKDGIWLPKFHDLYGSRHQKTLWDQLGQRYYRRDRVEAAPPRDYQKVFGQIGGLWNKFPENLHFKSILEIGCGDGRASVNLSESRGIDCDEYYGIDISEPQLRRLRKFKQVYDFYPSAQFTLICMAAKYLPLGDNSVDLVISDAVFMHLPQADLRILLHEISRVLKPGGMLVFRNSFHNRDCMAHMIRNIARRFVPGKNPIYSQQYALDEVKRLLELSGLADKAGPLQIVSNGQYALLPNHLGKRKVPFAKAINAFLKKQGIRHRRLVYSFDVHNFDVHNFDVHNWSVKNPSLQRSGIGL